MELTGIAQAMERVESAFRRHPAVALDADAPATAHWEGGTRVTTRTSSGINVVTDMPAAIGGTGDQVTPGWLLRAALASCATTRIAMAAAAEGIALTSLEVVAKSLSDARGLLGMPDEEGLSVFPGPKDVKLRVRIAAQGRSPEQLRSLVEGCECTSPVSAALRQAVPVVYSVEVDAG
jgi:uncharacterized OsmC-like protein